MKRRIFYVFIAFMLALNVFQAPVTEAQSAGGPVLVVYNTADGKFGPYIGEILHAEGLNSFDMAAIGVMDAGLLAQYQVVILGKTSLTAGQAADLTAFVNGGGGLIAMQPDAQIYPVLGLDGLAGQQVDGYIKLVNGAVLNGQAPGTGLSSETLQLHGSGDHYTLAVGAVALAELYSDAVTSSGFPAVVGKNSGSGWGVAYAYDLPANIIYTRQGNPANADLDVDGDTYIRTIDLFQGTPAWLDLNKVPIPQADEQQRFLGRLVKTLTSMPLPQLWYFPGTTKTMMIITSDSHGEPSSYYTGLIDSLSTYGAHDTFYLSQAGDPLPAELPNWIAAGHSFGIHPYPVKLDAVPPISTLTEGYTRFNDWFQLRFPEVQRSLTVRHHYLGWQGWTEAVNIASSFGMRMDTNFYHWGPWLKKVDESWAHGYITGSGLPMKFAALDGTILPVYQQATQLVDEQFNAGFYPPGYVEGLPAQGAYLVSKEIIDGSQSGNYAALTTQFHVGFYNNFPNVAEWANNTMAYAQSLNIPMWNADEWLAFTEARDLTTYQNLVWNPVTGVLTFSLDAAGAVNNQSSTLLPITYDGDELVGVKVDGVSQPYQQVMINEVPMAFVSVPTGLHAYSARYHAEADISITMTADPDPVVAGNQITYDIVVNNAGPDGAQNVIVSDTLPAGTSFASVTPGQGTCSGTSTVICDLGDIPVGSPVSISLVLNVDPARRTEVVNSVTISSLSIDVNPADNTATATTQVTANADVGITLADSPDPVVAGNNLVYTLTVTNSGPSSATDIVATLDLDAGVVYQGFAGANWSCVQGTPGIITCSRNGSLNVGANDSVNVTVKVDPGQVSVLNSSVDVDAIETDNNSSNNTASATTAVSRIADMGITFSGASPTVTAGNNLVYTMTATNHGPSTATGITATANLDPGVSYISSSGTNWSCIEGPLGKVTCTYTGTFNAGASSSVNVTVKVAPGQAAALSSTASVDAVEADGNNGNDNALANTFVNRSADMVVSLTAPSPVTAGTSLVYTLTTTNLGPSTATGVNATLTLESGVSFSTFSGTNWNCTEGLPGMVDCAYTGTLGVNADLSVTLTVDVAAGQVATLSSSADVDAVENDSNSANNTAVATTTVIRSADMSISMSGAPPTVVAGNNLVYSLVATNLGASTATGITAAIHLDSGVSYQTFSGTNWACIEGTPVTVTCTYSGTLDVAASASVEVAVRTAAGQVSELSSSVDVDAIETDNNSSNNTASATTAVDRKADIDLTLSDLPDPVIAGNNLVYSLGVHNIGPSTGTGIQVTLNLDAGVSYQGFSGSGWSCNEATGIVTCSFSGTLNVLGSDSVDVTVKVDPTRLGPLSSNGELSGTETDPVGGNNQASASTAVNRMADVTLTVVDSPDPIAVGQDLTYTLTIQNAGPSSAESPSITNILPAGVIYKSYEGVGWICLESAGTVTCDHAELLPGFSGTLQIVVTTPNEPVVLEYTGSVSSSTFDGDTNNNQATATTDVTPSVDLSVNLSTTEDPARAGNLLEYTLTVANLGLSTANSVKVEMTLPLGSEFVSALGTGWICNYFSGLVTCTMPQLAVSTASPIAILVRVPMFGSSLTAQAVVQSTSGDPSMENNSTELTTSLEYVQYMPVLLQNP